ncbi:hypothetical protein Q4506_14255 [Colwellia sp. 4_MG-2023]|jgi:hypothetical protein|uniref:hypothetical protein n=1 Tax=unclassified Colwellia TaxID=196834 RepID=UPI0026E3BB15|nr:MULTISPECIES: hypothetical protein [unclassified Colwellia]MDO6508129.1 hypothetical protein [Colwellia sp. 5_MG-2023]MDO6556847.1 hypothetical protein [Colwellia sp. 4_MG-2023]
MCSTPRPKTRVKGKAGSSDSVLSNLSVESRSLFAERANIAQERRHQMAMKQRNDQRQHDASIKKVTKAVNSDVNNSQNSLSYWLLKANLKDLFIMLFFGTSRRT